MTSKPTLSLVIPTYNRERFALRSMRFCSGRGVMVHVVDGSDEAIPQSELVALSENIECHHLPIPLFDRLVRAVGFVDTDYVAMTGDDEFFMPSALEACIDELEADQAVVSCNGRCLRFQVTGGEVVQCSPNADSGVFTRVGGA